MDTALVVAIVAMVGVGALLGRTVRLEREVRALKERVGGPRAPRA